MNIRCRSMLGTSHSWAVTMRNLLVEFYRKNHNLYLESINDKSLIQDILLNNFGKNLPEKIDLDISYTQPGNFSQRFLTNSDLKVAIYNYESSLLPQKWSDCHRYVDYVLPSSSYTKNIFVNAGWPEEKCIVVPHGIDPGDFDTQEKYVLTTDRRFKFLNVAVPHYRKNIDMVIRAYYDLFSFSDDVCLVIKTNLVGGKKHHYEYDFVNMLSNIQLEYKDKKNLPQIEIVSEKIENMATLYNSCDVLVSATSSEGFGLPLLEGLAAKKIVIAPAATGQIDFLCKNNSLLVKAKEVLAEKKYQYITYQEGATVFEPDFNDLKDKMLLAYGNYSKYIEEFKQQSENTVQKHTWSNVADIILGLK